jgi:hypothetical protein
VVQPSSSAAPAATTTGTVKLVDGSTLYVQTADGAVVTGPDTTVGTLTPKALKDLAAGAAVTVTGAAAADGTVAATTVTGR